MARVRLFYIKLYFQNKKKTDLWLGVTSLGLNIYELDNRLKPIITFPWNEVKDVSYKDRKVIKCLYLLIKFSDLAICYISVYY